ncbi:MAG: helix-turn-helix transcriptional regulator [Clostridia bacterium]|nr:helix-turn-helix transcriptional regulator [Clostridia bacterium]
MNIGEKLFELRKEKNLSQEEVAEKLNVTRQTVSKWETNQSTPDFDKIIPLCELFEISTEELLTGNKQEKINEEVKAEEKTEKILTKEEVKQKSAEVVSTSVFLYVVSIAFLMVAIPVFRMNPIVASAIFLCIIAWATARIVKHYMSVPKFEKTKQEKKEEKIIKEVNGIIGSICTVIYFVVSFATMAWHITWIIFIIDGILCQIVKLFFMLNEKEETDNEE